MKALLLIAHGSRLQASNDEVRELAEKLKPALAHRFRIVWSAFLEIAHPSIPRAIDDLVSQGVTEIVVMPWFLNRGRHVTEDVPRELEEKCRQYPEIDITMLPYIGLSEGIPGLLVEIVESETPRKL